MLETQILPGEENAAWEQRGEDSRLPVCSRELIYQLLQGYGVAAPYLHRHAPSYSAIETQAFMPPRTLVQKTLTSRMGPHSLLWTGVGNFTVTRAQVKEVAHHLQCSAKEMHRHQFNPPHINSIEAFGMLPGMVSTFLPLSLAYPLRAIIVLDWPSEWEQQQNIGISLSLHETLIFPLRFFRSLITQYVGKIRHANCVDHTVPLLSLSSPASYPTLRERTLYNDEPA